MSRVNILFGKNGTPLAISGLRIFASSIPSKSVNEDPRRSFFVGDKEFVSWGDSNQRPDSQVRIIGSAGVLSTAVGFKARTSYGQGVVAQQFAGYDESGEEILKPYPDPSVRLFLESYQFLHYADSAFRDLFKFGNAFPLFFFNAKGEIVNIITRNARHCRISRDKKYLLVYPNFDEGEPSDPKDCDIIPMLDEDDPFTDLLTRKAAGTIDFSKPIAYPRIRNYYSNTDYYGVPDWDAAWRAGWIDVANKVPRFLNQSYTNAMTMMWHIQVPYSWFEARFPEANYVGQDGGIEKRKLDIAEYFDTLEAGLTGDEGADRTLITEYGFDPNAKDDKWKVERLSNELDSKERLNTSAAANSEILFSMMINPSTLGAGMPGGSYAGNAGSGSDIRESYLVSVITTYIEKQQVLFPVRLMMEYNGKKDLILRFKETILTTLNSGNSQKDITT